MMVDLVNGKSKSDYIVFYLPSDQCSKFHSINLHCLLLLSNNVSWLRYESDRHIKSYVYIALYAFKREKYPGIDIYFIG